MHIYLWIRAKINIYGSLFVDGTCENPDFQAESQSKVMPAWIISK